jgi:hypothetical protein
VAIGIRGRTAYCFNGQFKLKQNEDAVEPENFDALSRGWGDVSGSGPE